MYRIKLISNCMYLFFFFINLTINFYYSLTLDKTVLFMFQSGGSRKMWDVLRVRADPPPLYCIHVHRYSFPNGRHWHYMTLALYGMTLLGTTLSGTVALSCVLCSATVPRLWPGTTLKPLDSAVPCHKAQHPSGLVSCLGTKTTSPLQKIRIKRTSSSSSVISQRRSSLLMVMEWPMSSCSSDISLLLASGLSTATKKKVVPCARAVRRKAGRREEGARVSIGERKSRRAKVPGLGGVASDDRLI